MHSKKTKNDDGVTVYQIWDGSRLVGSVFSAHHARLFTAAPQLLEHAEEALSYVNLFGQISMAPSTSKNVATNLTRVIAEARAPEEAQPAAPAP